MGEELETEDRFGEQLSGMMAYRTETASPFTPRDVVSAARRRSRSRSLGVAGSALAVVAVGVGAVTLAGGGGAGGSASAAAGGDPAAGVTSTSVNAAPATSAGAVTSTTGTITSAPASTSSSAGHGVSPVVNAASGEKLKVVDGVQMYVTKTEKCVLYSGAFSGNAGHVGEPECKDVAGDNMRWDGKGNWLSEQSTGNVQFGTVLTGTFQGSKAPSLIEVVQDGKHYPATIVTTGGMENWVAYYVNFPVKQGGSKTSMLPYTVSAYDADGHLLTQNPPVGQGSGS